MDNNISVKIESFKGFYPVQQKYFSGLLLNNTCMIVETDHANRNMVSYTLFF